MRRLAAIGMEPRIAGGLLCALGLGLLAPGSLVAAALGVELLATAFWIWARAAPDAGVQVARWAWLRRPATALWLAVVIHAMQPGLTHVAGLRASGVYELLRWLEAIAVLWAGLELMAALPVARPYGDLTGPLLAMRPWLPVMLPAAGFILLWRQSAHWTGVNEVRQAAMPLLLITAVLGALRAFARRPWTASLRWLAVTDSAMAGLLVSLGVVPAQACLLFWLAACGAHAGLLAGELRGAVTRRGTAITRLWRISGWTALACLSLPFLIWGLGQGTGVHVIYFAGAALTTALSAWITVGRMSVAPERRLVMRPDPVLTLSQAGAILVIVLGPLALGLTWWSGFEVGGLEVLGAVVPATFGGAMAMARRRGTGQPVWRLLSRVGDAAPGLASNAYSIVVNLERALVGLVVRIFRAATGPLHDLHTGDAQEYLLFLVGLGVLALVLPLLQ